MKKIISVVLVLSILAGCNFAWDVFAEPPTSGTCGAVGNESNIVWSFNSSTGKLTISGTGAMRDWRHQTSFDEYDTTLEGYVYTPWYEHRLKIKSAEISDGITVMGNFTFGGCTNLNTVKLSKDLTNIGVGAFEGCKSLKSVNVPSKVKFLGVGAFYDAANLSSVTLPEGLETIYYGAFASTSLQMIELPSTVKQLHAGAFAYCTELQYISLPEGVTGIGRYTFFYCQMLYYIEIKGDIKYINENAFYNCDSLFSIKIPESCTSIGENAFGTCDNLTIECYPGSYAETYCKQNLPNKYITVEHDFVFERRISATCTTQGYSVYYCWECDKYRNQDYVSALGHKMSDWNIAIVAKPTSDGKLACQCANCGTTQLKSYPYHTPGDTDLDEKLTVFDVILVLQHIAGVKEFDEHARSAADTNLNYTVDADDAQAILKRVCGFDITFSSDPKN